MEIKNSTRSTLPTRFNGILSGQPGRIMKYAIGEIVLVVIVILIALQINNWNEKRKEEEKIKIVIN